MHATGPTANQNVSTCVGYGAAAMSIRESYRGRRNMFGSPYEKQRVSVAGDSLKKPGAVDGD